MNVVPQKKSLCSEWENVKQWLGIVVLCFACWGCGEDPQQLFETAQFEEQQNNRAHARELYERIIQESPDSEVAKKSQKRLEELKGE